MIESQADLRDIVYRSRYENIPVLDCHSHIMGSSIGMKMLIELKDTFNFERMNVLSISGMGDLTQNIKCMLFKALYPEKSYIFGGLIHSKDGFSQELGSYGQQVKRLIELGCDGMKIIEGKPEVRKALGKPLDDPSFYEFYGFLESESIPVLLHIADPETFWNRNTIPSWALNNGWFYGDGSYNSKEDFYREVEGILTRFPGLKAIFAHFYFLSADMARVSDFLDRYVNVSIDLTPGTEMYTNFSKNPEAWRNFFIKYQDRILFGTDNCDTDNKEEIANMVNTVNLSRMFLETDKEYGVWDLKLKGIGLEREVLEKIYYKNFERCTGREPRSLNLNLAIDECRHTMDFALQSGLEKKVINEIGSLLEQLASMQ